jgi:hypothetical protein
MKKLILRFYLFGLALCLSSGCASYHQASSSDYVVSDPVKDDFGNARFWQWLPTLAPGEYGSWTP